MTSHIKMAPPRHLPVEVTHPGIIEMPAFTDFMNNVLDCAKMVFSPEGDNFVKLSYIVLDIGAKYLRRFFKEKWDETYPDEKWNSDNDSGENLYSKLKRKVWKAPHMQVYVEKWRKGNENEWDTTTLVKVLVNAGLNLIEECRPEGEQSNPLRSSEQLSIIRNIRNDFFAHLPSMSCLYEDFVNNVAKIKRVAKSLFGEEAEIEIDEIENSPLGNKIADQVQKLLQDVIKDFEKDLNGKLS